jgi:hypothetical protein
MGLKLTNNAIGRLASNRSSSDTTFILTTGDGSRFPALSAGDFSFATIIRASDAAIEIVKITARSSDTLTVQRAQEGTQALTLLAGDRVEIRYTAGSFMEEFESIRSEVDAANATADAALQRSGGTMTGPITLADDPETDLEAATKRYVDDTVDAVVTANGETKADKTLVLTAGAGLTGGGDLSGNRTFAIASGSNGFGTRTVSTSAPSGGNDGDIWYQY